MSEAWIKDSVRGCKNLPSRGSVEKFTLSLLRYLFPQMVDGNKIPAVRSLRRELSDILCPLKDRIAENPDSIAGSFISNLPLVREDLLLDAGYIADGDPAATGVDEVILAYPGFFAIAVFRLAHTLYELKVPLVPRMMTEMAHSRTGIDIHPGAMIGKEFFIDHGTGIVIGETAVIGRRVKLYQGVTLGALSVSRDMVGFRRHPTIEDDVIIYAGSTILGGSTVIGHSSIIGGNVWLTESVQPYSMVYNLSRVTVRTRDEEDGRPAGPQD